ncbi:MAG: leucine-rich repeat protein [Bacteroidales bacterium]|nr:leucine-rich repeat protein [Bacteroidales bacterium]
MESIVLPQGLKSIEGFAFMDCTNLKRLVISPTNEEILGILLCECRKIEKVEFNDGTEADLEVIKKKGAQVRRRRLS